MPFLLIFLLVLSFLVFVHEFGHFFLAKKAGIKVEEFGFGYPPRISGVQVGETIYSVNALPFGGFVRIYGQDQEVEEEVERSFYGQSRWVRSLVLVGGVVMNVLIGLSLFTIIYGRSGVPVQTDKVEIVGVAEDSPAAKSELKLEDQVLAIIENQQTSKVSSTEEFSEIIDRNKGKEIGLKVKRGEETLQVKLRPRPDKQIPEGEGSIGVIISDTQLKHFAWWKMPFLAIKAGISESFMWIKRVLGSLVIIFQQLFKGKTPPVTGVVGIYQTTKQAARRGFWMLLKFTGILSINLAVLNILPIPALDGGRLFFVGLESVIGKEKSRQVEQKANAIGMAVLIAIMILVTIKDIISL